MSSRKWVINASPIISLCRIGQIRLIHEMSSEVIIPAGVADEIDNSPVDDPAYQWIHQQGKKYIRNAGTPDPVVLAWDPGKGETEVIHWTYTRSGYAAILDDRAARHCAFSLNIEVLGTIGILVQAKREQKITSAEPLLEQLVRDGFRISPELLKRALQLAGEKSA